ncbi:MAG: hypothetical protein V3571_06870 [Pseudodesulfovibrio sp.]
MNKKMALPDELLDAVSGGVLTVGGNTVTELGFFEDGGAESLALVTAKGTYQLDWDDKTKAAIRANPSVLNDIVNDLVKDMNSSKVFRAEDRM